MSVWIVTRVCDYGIIGVFATARAAVVALDRECSVFGESVEDFVVAEWTVVRS